MQARGATSFLVICSVLLVVGVEQADAQPAPTARPTPTAQPAPTTEPASRQDAEQEEDPSSPALGMTLGSERGTTNPYASSDFSWQKQAPDLPAPQPTTEPQEETPKDRDAGQGQEEQPAQHRVADDTGHTVPSVSWGKKKLGKQPPFSVGGVTAVVDDDTFFKFYGFLQTRYVTGRHEESSERTAGGGFSLARARLFFYGGMTEWLRVLVRVGATSDGTARFEQAFVDFLFRNFTFRVGQFFLPVFQEQALSPVAALPLQTSAVGAVFDGGQTQGLRISWDLDPTRLHLFVTDGLRSGFSEVGSPQVADIAITSRIETVIGEGDYSQFNLGSAFIGEPTALLLGGGVHYQSGGHLTNDAVQLGSINLDATFKASRMNVSVSASAVNTEDGDGSRFYNYGLVGQGGYFLLPALELYGRYEALVSSASPGQPQSVFRGLTAGVNQYLWPERGIRAITDFTYHFDPTIDTPIAVDMNSGVFASSGPQWSLRMQLNVLF